MNFDMIRELIKKSEYQCDILLKENVLEWICGFDFDKSKENEKLWGEALLGKKSNQWTTKVGEEILKELLIINNKKPIRVSGKKSCNGKKLVPDWETESALYENKCRTYNIAGTIGEKILGTPYKYAECQELYKKPLNIVCMAFQEKEAEISFNIFNPKSKQHKEMLDLYSIKFGINFIKASSLLLDCSFIKEIISKKDDYKVKPIIKYAGGKRNIMKQIIPHFPDTFNNYHEPFIGGLSVFIELTNNGKILKEACLNDINENLISLYIAIRDSPEDFITECDSLKGKNSKEDYLNARKEFNDVKNTRSMRSSVLLVFLNKKGFNGLYRENSKGYFNVPFGTYSENHFINEKQIISLSNSLKNVKLTSLDFSELESKYFKDDFVYIDPPYFDTFSNYNKAGFSKDKHLELKSFFDDLNGIGCKVVLSNSDTEFIRDLYKDYTIIEIFTKRPINSNGNDRKNIVKELLIKN